MNMLFEDTISERLARFLLGLSALVMGLVVIAPFALLVAAPFLFRL